MKVWFSAGPQSTQVPDVKERSQEEARSILESAGFKVNAAVKTEDSADIAKDMVTKTDPAAGQSVPKGTTITIYVSSGMTTVPSNLVGQSKDSVLQQYEGKFSFTVEQESSDTVEAGLITRVSPDSGSSIAQGGSSPFGCPRARRRSLCRISPLALTTSPPNSCSRPWASSSGQWSNRQHRCGSQHQSWRWQPGRCGIDRHHYHEGRQHWRRYRYRRRWQRYWQRGRNR